MPWTTWSASQVETFRTCARKWHLNKIVGLPQPESASQALGKEVHASLEGFVLGTVPADKLHPIAAPAVPYVRALIGSGVKVELPLHEDPAILEALTVNGVEVRGFVDLWVPTQFPHVVDYKTTSGWRYAKTREQLRVNAQMLTYGHAMLTAVPKAVDVRLAHIQLLTKGSPEARYVSCAVPRAEVAEGFATVRADVEAMGELAAKHGPEAWEHVTPNYGACSAFGGCPYRSRCDAAKLLNILTPKPQGATVPTINPLQKMLAAKLAAKQAAPAPEPTSIIPPDATPDAECIPAPAAQVALPEAPKPKRVTKKAAPPVEVLEAPAVNTDREQVKQLGQDARVRDAVANGWSLDEVGRMDGAVLVYVAAMSVKRADVTLVEVDGIIKDLEDANGLVDPLQSNQAKPEPAPVIAPIAAPVIAPIAHKPEGLTLYVNCRPVRGVEYVELEAVVAPFMVEVAKATKAEHYTLVDYGKGPAMVAAMLSRSVPRGALVVDTRAPCAAACLEVLRPLASVVVEGMGR